MATQSDREIDWDVARLSGGLSASRRAAPAHQGSLRPSDWDLDEGDSEPLSERGEALSRDLARIEARNRPIIESIAPTSMETAVQAPREPPPAAAARTRPSNAENAFWTAAAAGMSVLAIGLVMALAVVPAPHAATSAVAAPAVASTLIADQGVPFAPRAVVNLEPVMVIADRPNEAAVVAAVPMARPARAVVAPSPDAIPPQLVIPPPAAAAPVAGAEMSRPAAAVAISVAGRRAASCLDADDARATMPVSVTFAPSGRVTTATVDGGPFAGTAVGGCIARALRSAKVAPFDGAPVTVHTSMRAR